MLRFSFLRRFACNVFLFSQLLYTGIVIYAPALILNQGMRVKFALRGRKEGMLLLIHLEISLYFLAL